MARDQIRIRYLWFPSSIALAFGLLFFFQPWSHWWPGSSIELVHGLGEAVIIAAVLAFTVDGYTKRHLINEIARDVFVHIFGHALPIELRGRINQMVRIDLIFRDFRIHYRLTPLAEKMVRVEVSQEYQIENLSGHTLPHQLCLFLEKQDSPEFLEFRCDPIDDMESRFCYSQNKRVEVSDKPDEPGVLQARAKKILLKPNVRYPIIARYTLRLPEDSSDICCFGQPTIGVSITIDECPEDFAFEVGHL